MLRVTIDIFSGRRNPTWVMGDDQAALILREIALHRSTVVNLPRHNGRLGYRRVILEQLNERIQQEFELPRVFSIADMALGLDAKGIEIAQKILDGSDSVMPANAYEFFSCQIANAARSATMTASQADELPPETLLPALSAYETTPFEAEPWNDPVHVGCNNCYAYAANQRTDTFAQPGRASGRNLASFTFEEIIEAAGCDGVVDAVDSVGATQAPRYLVALFVWPGFDYHWYRLHSDGSWGHKPGPETVRTVDNSDTSILDPRVCSRADYSDFAGFFIISKQCKIR